MHMNFLGMTFAEPNEIEIGCFAGAEEGSLFATRELEGGGALIHIFHPFVWTLTVHHFDADGEPVSRTVMNIEYTDGLDWVDGTGQVMSKYAYHLERLIEKAKKITVTVEKKAELMALVKAAIAEAGDGDLAGYTSMEAAVSAVSSIGLPVGYAGHDADFDTAVAKATSKEIMETVEVILSAVPTEDPEK